MLHDFIISLHVWYRDVIDVTPPSLFWRTHTYRSPPNARIDCSLQAHMSCLICTWDVLRRPMSSNSAQRWIGDHELASFVPETPHLPFDRSPIPQRTALFGQCILTRVLSRL